MLALIAWSALLGAGPQAPPDPEWAAYRDASARPGRSAAEQVRLALWSEARGFPDLRLKHLRLAVEAEPGHPLARRLLGQMDDAGAWRTPAEAIERARSRADRKEALARYDLRRERIADTPQAHWQMALWCEQAGLTLEAEAHLRAVARLDPSRDEAWKKLGARRQGGRWVTPDQAAAERLEAEARRQADARWRPLLAKWKTWLNQRQKQAEAEEALRGLTDHRAVPSIARVLGPGGPEDQGLAVRLLGQVDAPSASRGLASLAVFGASEVVRRSAAESLAGRDPRECAPWLIGLLRDPIQYEVRPVGGPGSPGELYVRGERVNTRRFYAAPPPLLDFRPGDTLGLDDYGNLVARRSVGHSSQPLQAALDPLYQGAPDMSGLGPKLAGTSLGASGQRLGAQLGRNHGVNSSLINGMGGGGAMSAGSGGFNTAVQADIPVGQMILQAEQQAASARQALRADVANLERYNDEVGQVNARALAALKVVSGESAGPTAEAWRKWWSGLEETSSVAPRPSRALEPEEPAPAGSRSRLPSFGRGTPVWTLDGVRPIEDLRAGDLILTQDFASASLAFSPVLSTRRLEPGLARSVRVGKFTIEIGDLERLWVAGRGWVAAGNLREGDPIRAIDGVARVGAVDPPRAQPAHHLQVAGRRGIFVGAEGLLARDDRVDESALAPFDSPPILSSGRVGRTD